jgi:hypothetical protein
MFEGSLQEHIHILIDFGIIFDMTSISKELRAKVEKGCGGAAFYLEVDKEKGTVRR